MHDKPTDDAREAIEMATLAVVNARRAALTTIPKGSSLADLYDPLTMPAELLKAHQVLDLAVDVAYGRKAFAGDIGSHTTDQIMIYKAAAGLGLDYFIYAGPDDIVARPFCHALVNRAFTREAIELSNNGQIPGVMISRGGYNCRHRWRPVAKRTIDFLKVPLILPFKMHMDEFGTANQSRIIIYPVSV